MPGSPSQSGESNKIKQRRRRSFVVVGFAHWGRVELISTTAKSIVF
jgi:hypothetical protein